MVAEHFQNRASRIWYLADVAGEGVGCGSAVGYDRHEVRPLDIGVVQQIDFVIRERSRPRLRCLHVDSRQITGTAGEDQAIVGCHVYRDQRPAERRTDSDCLTANLVGPVKSTGRSITAVSGEQIGDASDW